MNSISHVPPGFRFHPTDEELVDYYLRKRVASKQIDLDVIKDVDLYNIEPWDLEGSEEQNDWYFFSHKDKKYPTGTRTNRATKAGFWKATGRDKSIYCRHTLVGMRKTLVFYKGRAPNGHKSDWIMHEYRLETNENGSPQEEGWVVCKVFKKRMPALRRGGDYDSPSCNWYDHDQVSFVPESIESPTQIIFPNYQAPYNIHNPFKQELEQFQYNVPYNQDTSFFLLPQTESPNEVLDALTAPRDQCVQSQLHNPSNLISSNGEVEEVINADWRVLDKFVASQLISHDYNHFIASMESNYGLNSLDSEAKRVEIIGHEHASPSICSVDIWK